MVSKEVEGGLENTDITLAKQYHEETKHSEISIRTKVHYLDRENRPLPYKTYTKLTPIKLPTDFPHPAQNAIDSIMTCHAEGATIDVRTIAELLHFSAGITKRIKFPSGEVYDFRAAAATGALYEVETYLVCGKTPGLAAGVYHFNPQDFTLRQLRAGDFRTFLCKTAGKREEILSAPVTVILTAMHWRNAWKYEARSYRHFFWDSGTILANLLATAVSAELATKVILGFLDESVNHLLGLDNKRESAVVLVPLGSQSIAADPSYCESASIPKITHEYVALSKREVEYPEVLKIHSSSALRSPEEVRSWRTSPPPKTKPERHGELYPLQPVRSIPKSPLGKTIVRRGSTRQFSREAIPYSHVSTILQASTSGIPADFLGPKGSTLIDIYLVVNAVDGILEGAYYYDKGEEALEFLKPGNFRDTAGYLCLEQPLGSDGSVAAFLMSNLDAVLRAYGNRGYRAAQLEAGIMLGKMYLCAYALGIGATGITFYDDAVTAFFSPHAAGKSNMVSAILGVPAYGKKPKFQVSM